MAKTKQLHDHILREIPNTQENRDFWHGIAKQMQKSDSRWTLRLRGRSPNLDKIMEQRGCTLEEAKRTRRWRNDNGGIPLSMADHFSVYVVPRAATKRFERSSWNKGYDYAKQAAQSKLDDAQAKIEELEQRILRMGRQEDSDDAALIAELKASHEIERRERQRADQATRDLREAKETIYRLEKELVDFESGNLRVTPILGQGDGVTVTLNIHIDTKDGDR